MPSRRPRVTKVFITVHGTSRAEREGLASEIQNICRRAATRRRMRVECATDEEIDDLPILEEGETNG